MAITNHERVGKMLELLTAGLKPFVERELKSTDAPNWFAEAKLSLADSQLQLKGTPEAPQWDAAAILVTMWNEWNNVFRKTLGHAERTLVSELREIRNRWAHQRPFSTDDAYRSLDSAARLLTAVSAAEGAEVEKMKMELLRVRFDEQARTEKRKSAGANIESVVQTGLKPWREVVQPHKDVASGKYQQAEFAADLWQVHLGEGSDEYLKPAEFFQRTFLTESLKGMLIGAVQRLGDNGGDPVVQLQTNFGGGKTHSMLALYHLFSGTPHSELLGVDETLEREAPRARAFKEKLGRNGDPYRLTYLARLPLEANASMLNLAKLEHPFAYTIEVLGENGPHTETVDLVETFNFLHRRPIGFQEKVSDWRFNPATR